MILQPVYRGSGRGVAQDVQTELAAGATIGILAIAAAVGESDQQAGRVYPLPGAAGLLVPASEDIRHIPEPGGWVGRAVVALLAVGRHEEWVGGGGLIEEETKAHGVVSGEYGKVYSQRRGMSSLRIYKSLFLQPFYRFGLTGGGKMTLFMMIAGILRVSATKLSSGMGVGSIGKIL